MRQFFICDNVLIYEGKDSVKLLNKLCWIAGVQIIFLSSYSLELNPCKMVKCLEAWTVEMSVKWKTIFHSYLSTGWHLSKSESAKRCALIRWICPPYLILPGIARCRKRSEIRRWSGNWNKVVFRTDFCTRWNLVKSDMADRFALSRLNIYYIWVFWEVTSVLRTFGPHPRTTQISYI